MNQIIEVYCELDTLFDPRRMIIQKWITRHLAQDTSVMTDEQYSRYMTARRHEGDNQWALHIEQNYRARRFDHFNFPFTGLNKTIFDQLYKERTVQDWGFGWYPTNFQKDLVKVIIDQEGLTDRPISIEGIRLHINTHPYVLDDALKAELLGCVKTWFAGRVDAVAVEVDTFKVEPSYYKAFNYVFKYDFFLGNYEVFFKALEGQPIPDVAFLVPDIQKEETSEFVGTPYELLYAQSFGLLSHLRTIPILHRVYDYA